MVGMSLGGLLVQLLMLDAPARVRSATLLCTGALETDPPVPGLPGPAPEVLALWEQLGERRDREAEVAFNIEHWRLLSGARAAGHSRSTSSARSRSESEITPATTSRPPPTPQPIRRTSRAAPSWPACAPRRW